MFVVVDASVWIARFVPSDVFHDSVKSWINDQLEDGVEFISPSLLLAEIGGAISRRTSDPELALRTIEQLEKTPNVRIVDMDQSLVHEASRLSAKIGLRGADAVYVATAAKLKIPLVTFNVEQKNRAKKVVEIWEIG